MASQIGASAQIFQDGRDISKYLRSIQITLAMASVRNTTFRPPGKFHTAIAGLRGGQISYSGDMPSDAFDRAAELADAIGDTRSPRLIQVCPYGAEVGYLAFLGWSQRTSFDTSTEVEGLISYNGGFEITSGSPGVRAGLCLFTPNGSTTLPGSGTNAVQTLVTHITGDAGFNLTFDGQTVATAPTYGSSFPDASQIQAALESLSNIAPGDVTVEQTVHEINGSYYDTESTITFGGAYAATAVPQITSDTDGVTPGTQIPGAEPVASLALFNVVSATVNGTAINDVSAATTNGLVAVLEVVSADGDDKTITCRVAHSSDGTTYAGLATFDAMTDVGAQQVLVDVGTTINKYLRLEVTDITGDFVITASFVRL